MTIEEKLEHFKNYAMEEARSQSTQQLDEYQEALEKIFQEHKDERCRQEELQIKIETEQIVRDNNKELSQKQMQIKQMLRQRQQELKDKIFVEVKDLLGRFMATPAYRELLIRQMEAAIRFAAGEELIIYIDPADSLIERELEARLQIPVTVSRFSFQGGMRAVIPSKNILIDNSFETKLAEERERFIFKGGEIS